MANNSQGMGVLVTGTQEESHSRKERLVKQNWEKHFTRDQWNVLTKEEKESFLLRDCLMEMLLDMDQCLVRCVEPNNEENYTFACIH